MNQKEIKQELYIKEWEQLYSRQQESGMQEEEKNLKKCWCKTLHQLYF